jgi:hypothetical protein
VKLLAYVVGGFVVMAVAALLIARGQAPEDHPAILLAFVALFAIPPLGAFWMMYMSIRNEKSPFPMVLLAFIPFTFLWYYFERVRTGKLRRLREQLGAGPGQRKLDRRC